MAVVVSDTTPLHYLILVGQETILEKLYGKVFIPPAVLTEMSHRSAPVQISRWAADPPAWLSVVTPGSIPAQYAGLDFGEREALALAKELHANLILLDDKVARRVAQREMMRVKGTLGIIADAAKVKFLDFAESVDQLQHAGMYLDQDVVDEVKREYNRRLQKEQS
jgi:predicted nucleic acid-binding protein